MTIVNNVDLDKISQTVENGKKDGSSLKKPVKLHGEWNLDPSKGYQFRTELSFEKGKQVIEIDSPSFLGGAGNRLGPMGYCVAGITSCFIGTFVSIASAKGIKMTMKRAEDSVTVFVTSSLKMKNKTSARVAEAAKIIIFSQFLLCLRSYKSVPHSSNRM